MMKLRGPGAGRAFLLARFAPRSLEVGFGRLRSVVVVRSGSFGWWKVDGDEMALVPEA